MSRGLKVTHPNIQSAALPSLQRNIPAPKPVPHYEAGAVAKLPFCLQLRLTG